MSPRDTVAPRSKQPMFGSILSKAIRVATLPLDAANALIDVAIDDGDGSKESRMAKSNWSPLQDLEKARDAVAKTAEDIDHA